MPRENVLVIRLSAEELRAMKATAGTIPVSTWARERLLRHLEIIGDIDPRQLTLDHATKNEV